MLVQASVRARVRVCVCVCVCVRERGRERGGPQSGERRDSFTFEQTMQPSPLITFAPVPFHYRPQVTYAALDAWAGLAVYAALVGLPLRASSEGGGAGGGAAGRAVSEGDAAQPAAAGAAEAGPSTSGPT